MLKHINHRHLQHRHIHHICHHPIASPFLLLLLLQPFCYQSKLNYSCYLYHVSFRVGFQFIMHIALVLATVQAILLNQNFNFLLATTFASASEILSQLFLAFLLNIWKIRFWTSLIIVPNLSTTNAMNLYHFLLDTALSFAFFSLLSLVRWLEYLCAAFTYPATHCLFFSFKLNKINNNYDLW